MRFAKVLVANRGEIACRVIRTLKRLGIASVAIYSDADRDARHVALADEAVRVGPAPAADSYLNVAAILAAARETGAQAVHPGYGFLSEHAGFADACEAAGLRFIGPRGDHMRAFGLKHTARALAAAQGVALLPGTGLLDDVATALAEADAIGYPVMLKSTAGGGGIGMSLCRDAAQLEAAFESVVRLGNANFAHAGVYLEKFVEHARHIEVQIFGDGLGGAIALGERDCSVQRRNQKVIEETPAPDLSGAERDALHASAVRLARAVGYASAGTVEFVFDANARQFYFLEVNTRLQVEHCVTEAVTGVDLVEWMILQAEGDLPPLDTLAVAPRGASIQVRLYAEDPHKQFQPSAGLLTHVAFPDDVRVDGWIEAGTEISAHYDPLLAKLIVRGDTRRDALAALQAALARTELYGIETNLDYLRAVVGSDTFARGAPTTAFLSRFSFAPHTIDVLDGGVQTTVQQAPGRVGYWSVGVPPSGPMDDRAFDLANALLGNARDAAGLEFTMVGATLRFNTATLFVLGGAPLAATLDGEPAPFWQVLRARPGAVLKLGGVMGAGVRACLAVKGGLQVPDYLGSKATFTLGQFGGHAGRALRKGDVLHLHADAGRGDAGATLAAADVPALTHAWTLGVLDGPHGAPDFFTPDDIAMLYGTQWTVHYNSSRTGVRLIGPKPQWARVDGGEAGLHPSNIHDNAYAIGAVDFTGDMPVILGPDGPSLGGFVCPVTVVRDELWKLGQLRPGDTVQFVRARVSPAPAAASIAIAPAASAGAPDDCVLHRDPSAGGGIGVVYRRSGDRNVLVEYGPLVLDLNLRFRVHALMCWLDAHRLPGMLDLTPGIRSLQVQFDARTLPLATLLAHLQAAERELPDVADMRVPNRVVHLPLSWDDPSTRVDGSSHDSGRCTTRFGTRMSATSGSSRSAACRCASSVASGSVRASNCTCSERIPGVRSSMPGSRCASSQHISACTRKRRLRSSTSGPYSTSTLRSPERRYTTPMPPPADGSRCSTQSSGAPADAAGAIAIEAAAGAGDTRARTNCTVSPGRNCPSFHNSSRTTVTGHTKPPRLGPSGPRITGMSPVKSTAPIAYALSWMFDGCRPASPPSTRAHCGFGPISRTPVRLEL